VVQERNYLKEKFNFKCVPLKEFKRSPNNEKKIRFVFGWSVYRDTEKECPDTLFEKAEGIAIITGKPSNIIVLDFDSREAIEAVEKHCNTKIEGLSNYIIKTARGYHLFYKYDDIFEAKTAVRKGLDILTKGKLSFANEKNPGYILLKGEMPGEIPQCLKEYILGGKTTAFNERSISNYNPYTKPLCFLCETWLNSKYVTREIKREISARLLKNTPYDQANREGQRHDLSIHLAGICASDPTIDENLYEDFCRSFIEDVIQPDDDINELLEYCYTRNFDYDAEWEVKHKDSSNVAKQLEAKGIYICYSQREDKWVVFEKSYEGPTFKFTKSAVVDYIKKKTGNISYKMDIRQFDFITDQVYDIKKPSGVFSEGERFFENLYIRSKYMELAENEIIRFATENLGKPKMPNFIGKILKNIVPDEEQRGLLLHNIAHHIKTKEVPQTAIVLLGKQQGTGKGIFFDKILGRIYGHHFLKLEASSLSSNFNGEIENKLFVHCNEIAERRTHFTTQTYVNKFKNLIAEDIITIVGKGKETKNAKNHAFIVMSSNEEQPFKIDVGDNRRFNFFRTSNIPLREVCPEIETEDIDEIIEAEIEQFIVWLAWRAQTTTRAEYRRVIKTDLYESIKEASTPISEKIASAIVEKNIEALEEYVSEDFARLFERDVIKANLAYIKVSALKKHFNEEYVYVKRALASKGILFEGRYLPAEKIRARVCLWNAKGKMFEKLQI